MSNNKPVAEEAVRKFIKYLFIEAQKGGGYTKETEDYFLHQWQTAQLQGVADGVVSKEEYEQVVNIIGQLQEQLKEANEHINDLNKGYEH